MSSCQPTAHWLTFVLCLAAGTLVRWEALLAAL